MIRQDPSALEAAASEIDVGDLSLPAHAGWGRCRVCECMGFKDTGEDFQVCDRCGHHWTDHR